MHCVVVFVITVVRMIVSCILTLLSAQILSLDGFRRFESLKQNGTSGVSAVRKRVAVSKQTDFDHSQRLHEY